LGYTELLEERAKERLTGAAIVVALVVLLVPEIFRGDRASNTATATAVADGPPLRSLTIELDKSGTVQAPAASPVPVPATVPQPATQSLPPVAVEAPPAATPVATAAPSPPPTVDSPAAGWVVQVGSFAKRENAERMVQQAAKRGARLVVAGPDGRGLYRVRTAPQADRRAAAELQAQLKAQGFAGVISASQ
jgi:cell division protein FtsN